MAISDNAKYSRDELEKIVKRLGYIREEKKDNGDHRIFSHKIYKDLKVIIPAHKTLNENSMKNISSVIIITMKILDMDTSIFKGKDGVEGKLHSAVKRVEKEGICVLFDRFTRNCLGIVDSEGNEAIETYIKGKRKELGISTTTTRGI